MGLFPDVSSKENTVKVKGTPWAVQVPLMANLASRVASQGTSKSAPLECMNYIFCLNLQKVKCHTEHGMEIISFTMDPFRVIGHGFLSWTCIPIPKHFIHRNQNVHKEREMRIKFGCDVVQELKHANYEILIKMEDHIDWLWSLLMLWGEYWLNANGSKPILSQKSTGDLHLQNES